MGTGYFNYPMPQNEPVLQYAPGSPERKQLKATLAQLKSEVADIPMYINGREIFTSNKIALHPPHEITHTLGSFSMGDEETQGEGSHSIVAPGSKKRNEKSLSILQLVRVSMHLCIAFQTLVSKFRSLFRSSDNSGAVMRLLFKFCTIMLANSTSSSFSMQSASVR